MFWKKITPKNPIQESNFKKSLSKIPLKDSYIHLAKIIQILIEDYGFAKSSELGIPVDCNQNPLPLYSYPAIEYLNSLDFENKKVFEFGSGISSLYWLSKKVDLVSVENDQRWFDEILNRVKTQKYSNHRYLFLSDPNSYVNSILEFSDDYFDVIVVDGSVDRNLCAKNIFGKIKKDGMIIFDNSEWHQETVEFLDQILSADFIKVGFSGFRPSKPNTSVTTIFIGRNSEIKSLKNIIPLGGVKR